MSKRLYYEDAYRTRFEAHVAQARQQENGWWLLLSQSAFYPTGGGQPCDLGTLSTPNIRAQVLDVISDEAGDVWHLVDKPLAPGTALTGEIDWERRFDHMQQHLGEHILAGSLYTLTGGFTHGLHIGGEWNSIDVTLPDGRTRLTQAEIEALETLANERVQRDDPVKCWFPDAKEMSSLPLRKEPTVDTHVRIVAAGGGDMVACGGTHVSSTGQVGQIKVLGTQPARGKLRITFVCGMRALRYFRRIHAACEAAGQMLSAPPEELAPALALRLDELAALRAQVAALMEEQAASTAAQLLGQAQELPVGDRLIRAHLAGRDAQGLKTIAALLLKQEPHAVALLGAPRAGGLVLVFARGELAQGDMAKLMRRCAAKGGGKPDFAQGSGNADSLQQAFDLLYKGGTP